MKKVIVCANARANLDQPSCATRGAVEITDALKHFDCLGSCSVGPNVKLVPGGRFLHHVRPQHLVPVLRVKEAFALAGDA